MASCALAALCCTILHYAALCFFLGIAWRSQRELLKDLKHLHDQLRFVILFNLVSLGIEVDIAAKVGQNDVPKYFDYMNLIVVIIFIMELAVACWQVQASVPDKRQLPSLSEF